MKKKTSTAKKKTTDEKPRKKTNRRATPPKKETKGKTEIKKVNGPKKPSPPAIFNCLDNLTRLASGRPGFYQTLLGEQEHVRVTVPAPEALAKLRPPKKGQQIIGNMPLQLWHSYYYTVSLKGVFDYIRSKCEKALLAWEKWRSRLEIYTQKHQLNGADTTELLAEITLVHKLIIAACNARDELYTRYRKEVEAVHAIVRAMWPHISHFTICQNGVLVVDDNAERQKHLQAIEMSLDQNWELMDALRDRTHIDSALS